MTEVFFLLKCAPYSFGVIQRTISADLTKLMIGNTKVCVHFSVYDDNTANLDAIGYDEGCSKDVPLDKIGGSVKMLKASLKLLCKLFPDISYVTLKDLSQLNCYGKTHVSLPELYIAKYKKTWYQMKFNAEPEYAEDFQDALKKVNSKLDEPLTQDYSEFYNTYVQKHHIKVKDLYNNLKTFYNQSQTMRQFIKIICSTEQDCIMFDKWLSYYMCYIGMNNLRMQERFFQIQRDTINNWSDEITIVKTDKRPILPSEKKIWFEGGDKVFDVSELKRK